MGDDAQEKDSKMALDNNDFNWGDLEDHVNEDGKFSPPQKTQAGPHAKVIKFTCTTCFGSGKWQGGRTNSYGNNKCHACQGRGFFLTSEAERSKQKQQRVVSKNKSLAEAAAAFEEQYPGLREWIARAGEWSDFARDMTTSLGQYGALTERQAQACLKMQATCAARDAERAAKKVEGNKQIDLVVIKTMFDNAVANGYKKPVYRAAGLILTRAPDTGRNPGALYVTNEADEYLGKILGTQYTGKPATGLEAIAADPKGEAIRYGQRTGRCSCCGRLLTNEGSIEAGIGPICAMKWGL